MHLCYNGLIYTDTTPACSCSPYFTAALTDTGAILLTRGQEQNESLQELKLKLITDNQYSSHVVIKLAIELHPNRPLHVMFWFQESLQLL